MVDCAKTVYREELVLKFKTLIILAYNVMVCSSVDGGLNLVVYGNKLSIRFFCSDLTKSCWE